VRVWKKLVEAEDDNGQLGVVAATATKPAEKANGFGVRGVRGVLHRASRGYGAGDEDSLALHPATALCVGRATARKAKELQNAGCRGRCLTSGISGERSESAACRGWAAAPKLWAGSFLGFHGPS